MDLSTIIPPANLLLENDPYTEKPLVISLNSKHNRLRSIFKTAVNLNKSVIHENSI